MSGRRRRAIYMVRNVVLLVVFFLLFITTVQSLSDLVGKAEVEGAGSEISLGIVGTLLMFGGSKISSASMLALSGGSKNQMVLTGRLGVSWSPKASEDKEEDNAWEVSWRPFRSVKEVPEA